VVRAGLTTYSKRNNYYYILEQCGIDFKSPLIPLFQRGRFFIPLFGKEGLGEIRMDASHSIESELIRLY
jgi:hypothetical protein